VQLNIHKNHLSGDITNITPTGIVPNGDVFGTSISNDVRYIAINSPASNLVAQPDNNGSFDVFVIENPYYVSP
jgi:hypothetical protein